MKAIRFPLVLSVVAAVALSVSAKDPVFTMPRAFHAKTYPAHEEHTDEKLSIAADPYDLADKAAGVFKTNYKNEDLLPIFLIVSNDSDQPVSLADMSILLVTKKRVRISPSESGDLFRRLSHQAHRGDEPRVQLPIPLPKKNNRNVSRDAQVEVEGSLFLAKAVEPHSTKAGFLFFDVEDIENPLAGAKLVVNGLIDHKGKEMFYFEIPMEKYLGYQPLSPAPKP